MRFLILSTLLISTTLSAQTPGKITRPDRSGAKYASFENPQHFQLFSTVSGARELAVDLPLDGVVDFDWDAAGNLYFLTADGEIAKWKAQSAGFEFRRATGLANASAITTDATGTALYIAGGPGEFRRYDGATGELIESIPFRQRKPIQKLRFDDATQTLYAQGADFLAAVSAKEVTMHASKGVALPEASKTQAEIYPTGFYLDPPWQSVSPGGVANFTLRTVPRDQVHGPYPLTVEVPLPYTLERNTLSINDASLLTIPIPANQAPGVYRIVARLGGGTNGIANAVFIIPFPGSTIIPISGTDTPNAVHGNADPAYTMVSSPDPECQTAMVAHVSESPIGGTFWDWSPQILNYWISGRAFANLGCYAGLYRYRHVFDLRDFDPATANIAVAAWADNAVTLEINGTPIPSETQELSEPEAFRIPRIYGLPREALRKGSNALDFIVRNDPYLTQLRNPTGLKVKILNATAVPVQSPEPPPVGDFWLSLDPPFKIVNGTTVQYKIVPHRIGGFAGTPVYSINITPPTGYSATINGDLLTVTRDPNVTTAQTFWRFAVLGIFNQTTRSVDGAFLQSPYVPVDLAIASTGVVNPGVPALDNSIDTHYTLSSSADPNFPGPSAYVAEFARSPFGPWILNDQYSKWIAPRADTLNSNAAGVYRYRTTFEMGLGAADFSIIAIRWAADNYAKVYLNGVQVAGLENIDNFRRLNEALITQNFKQGTNVLEFAVENANLGGASPTALRVELIAAQAARNPNRVIQVLRNRSVQGPVLLNSAGFTYTAPTGVTVTAGTTNLNIAANNNAPLGVFPVSVTYNSGGGTTNFQLVIGADQAVSYLVNSTGQADEGTLDPNYKIVVTPDMQFPTQDAWVILSNTSPVSLGFWTSNTINSRWIAPRKDTLRNNAPGTYRYRTTFDLSGRLTAGAMLALEWACDNRGYIELNGTKVDEMITNGEGFRSLRPVSITTGFKEGVNNLDFVVMNDGLPYDISPTGLHVNMLGGFAVSVGTNPGPDFTITPDPGVRTINAGQSTTFDVRLNPNFTFVDPVQFSVVNPPAGFTWSFSPAASKTTTVLTVTAAASVAKGTYSLTIRGRYGDIVREIPVRIDIAVGLPTLKLASTGQATAGSVDPNYTITDGLGFPLAAYVLDLSNAPPHWGFGKWIGPSRSVETTAAGTYRYKTSFDLTGYVPSTTRIAAEWDADDTVDCYLNGTFVATLTKVNLYDVGQLTIDSGFKAGINTLEFVVTNTTPSATGLMVTFKSATAQLQ